MQNKESVVTPWEVKGEIDYDALIRQFGVEPLSQDLLDRLKKQAGYLHVLLRRKMFFAHRELGEWMDSYERASRLSSIPVGGHRATPIWAT